MFQWNSHCDFIVYFLVEESSSTSLPAFYLHIGRGKPSGHVQRPMDTRVLGHGAGSQNVQVD